MKRVKDMFKKSKKYFNLLRAEHHVYYQGTHTLHN